MTVVLAALALAPQSASWTLLLGGDVMLNAVPVTARPFRGIAPEVRRAGLAFANLEIPLTRSRTPTTAKTAEELERRDQFILKANPDHAASIAAAGWDAVSLGNNHTMDYGPEGLREMLRRLDAKGVRHAGAGETADAAMQPASLVAPDGTRVALLSALAYVGAPALRKCGPATTSSPGIAVLSFGGIIGERAKAKLASWIGEARQDHDFVVVALHWGREKQSVPTAYQISLGRAVIRAGADVVWGHHPHVLQGTEWIDGKPILYSTGNLVSPLPSNTALFRLTIRERKVTDMEVLPARIAGGRVTWANAAAAKAERNRQAARDKALRKAFPNRNKQKASVSIMGETPWQTSNRSSSTPRPTAFAAASPK